MIKLALTGGIGAGKTTVAKVFEILNTPVYYADKEAKKISAAPEMVDLLIDHFGTAILNQHNSIDNKKLAAIVFQDTAQLQHLNAMIHPLVMKDFENWCKQYNHQPVVVMESAIIFEAKLNCWFDKIINVYAPLNICMKRIKQRNHLSDEDILSRFNSQLSPEEKNKLADFVIFNDEEHLLMPQVLDIYNKVIS